MKCAVLPISLLALVAIAVPANAATETIYFVSQQTRPNQISGKVISIDGDDFILDTGNRRIEVDAKSRSIQQANLKVGDQITIIGEFDDDEFDARTIIRADGSRISVSD